MDNWNSNQYTIFETERTQPSIDLIKRIDFTPKSIIDIGCGPGNSTNQLFKNFPNATILGVDNSDNMLEAAKRKYPHLNFDKCTVPDGLSDFPQYDLVFSNACLHWIPNHKKLYGLLMSKLHDNGVLAVQMPLVQIAPFYKIINEMVSEDKWNELCEVNIFHNPLPDETYDILSSISNKIDIWETVYYHILSSHKEVIDWYKGSGLRPYLDKLTEKKREIFINDLLKRISLCFPYQLDGKIILKMPRLFFLARK